LAEAVTRPDHPHAGAFGADPRHQKGVHARLRRAMGEGKRGHRPSKCGTKRVSMPAHKPALKPATETADDRPFWRRKAMRDMTQAEWESLCDGCGRCCLNKLQEEGSDRTFYTDVGCRLLDPQSCRCKDYKHRAAKVKDCVTLTPRNINRISWLPPTCAYKLVAAGRDLYWWHPLVSGDPETVHAAGVSVRGKVGASEVDVPDKDLEDHIVSWPLKWPKGAKG
jgi:uncharacterized cysteine cluster protein YcgN (CxxCxxCC family)